MKYKRILAILASSSAIAAAQPAIAQNDGNSREQNVIVVTANKRTENLKDVGMTISALSGEMIANRKATSLQDIASLVPGLAYAPSQGNTPIFTLRGVGFNERSLGVYPAVSVYLDQTPLPFPVLASHTAFDLERIEVLKGPQGTLFGQNSTGGAINYIAAKPTEILEAGGDVSFGRFNTVEGNAYISGPISETIGGRLAVTGLNSDDWQYSHTRDDTNGHQSYLAGRLLLEWDAGDNTKFLLNVNGFKDKSQPQALQLVAKRAQIQDQAQPDFLALEFAPSNPRAADWSNQRLDPGLGEVDPVTGATTPGTAKLNTFDPYSDRDMWQVALRGDIGLTRDITLTSMTSYTHFRQRQGVDGDGTYLVLTDLTEGRGYIKSFNQELRVANDSSNSLRWIVGGNYEDSRTLEDENLRYFDNSNYNAANLFINSSGVISRQNIRNLAVFGNIEYEAFEGVTLKAGARYTHSKNRNYNCGYTSDTGNVDKLFNILGDIFGTVPFTPIGPSDCYTLNDQGVPGEPFRKTLKEDNVSWRIGVDYKLSDQTLLYANVSRGYKAGSFPEISAANYTGLQPVVQESVTAFEGGLKTQALDGLVDLNAAAFYYDYKDKQIRGKLLDPVFGVLDALVNVPKSRIIGAEADLTIRPAPGLTINGAITFLDSKVREYDGFNLLGFVNDFSGDDLPFTPKWSGVVNVDYRTPINSGGAAFAGVSVNARSGSDASLGGSRISFPSTAVEPATAVKDGVEFPYSMNGYTTLDARIGFEAEDGMWKIMAWGKNILNEYYWTNVIAGNDTTARFAGRPATYGITFGYKIR